MMRSATTLALFGAALFGAPAVAGSYTCPSLQPDAGQAGVWMLIDPSHTAMNAPLLSLEVYDGPPQNKFQLRPSAAQLDGATMESYDLSEVKQAYVQCRYTGRDLRFVMALEAGVATCQTTSKDGETSLEITCE